MVELLGNGRINMEWMQFTILIVTLGTLFFWNRSEANADRRDLINLVRSIHEEMKDFHGRLCTIEERVKK